MYSHIISATANVFCMIGDSRCTILQELLHLEGLTTGLSDKERWESVFMCGIEFQNLTVSLHGLPVLNIGIAVLIKRKNHLTTSRSDDRFSCSFFRPLLMAQAGSLIRPSRPPKTTPCNHGKPKQQPHNLMLQSSKNLIILLRGSATNHKPTYSSFCSKSKVIFATESFLFFE